MLITALSFSLLLMSADPGTRRKAISHFSQSEKSMRNAHSYLFLNVAVLITAISLTWGRPEWRRILSRWWIARAAALFAFWCVVDWIAVSLRLWQFPPGGTLPFRAAGLPFEEYLVFVVHAILTTFAAGEPEAGA